MNFEAKKIKEIYEGYLSKKYDFANPPFFKTWKKKACADSSLKNGDLVLVFCCGTGLDFPYILDKIGNNGKIIGIDFSSEMLKKAEEKIKKKKWTNIELINTDITNFKNKLTKKADVGICTLGMSIIPDYKSAYYNLLSNVKKQGEIIIGDMQLATGLLACFNPLTIFLSRKFGGTHEGHHNSLKLCSLMKNELLDVRKREFFFGSYYYCIGSKI
ncbi:methyltransferase domain-containing protein [Candidatus Margulisiibacteriota bacterium]